MDKGIEKNIEKCRYIFHRDTDKYKNETFRGEKSYHKNTS